MSAMPRVTTAVSSILVGAYLASLASAQPTPAALSRTLAARHRLALLVAAPQQNETAMQADLDAMRVALQRRGFADSELLTLDGPLDPDVLTRFLRAAAQRIATWPQGEVLLYYTGHGFYSGETVADARPGLHLAKPSASNQYRIYWDEVFAVLAVPPHVRLVLLPDC
jgi:hypothetical protein